MYPRFFSLPVERKSKLVMLWLLFAVVVCFVVCVFACLFLELESSATISYS